MVLFDRVDAGGASSMNERDRIQTDKHKQSILLFEQRNDHCFFPGRYNRITHQAAAGRSDNKRY